MSLMSIMRISGSKYGAQEGKIRLYLNHDGGVWLTLKEGVNHLEALCMTPEEAIKLAENILRAVKDGLLIEEKVGDNSDGNDKIN